MHDVWTIIILQRDGAGAHARFGLVSRIGQLGIAVGVRMIDHYIGKLGKGNV